jgi:hypothetical protein
MMRKQSTPKYLGQTSRPLEETETPGEWVVICVRKNITCSELWVEDKFGILAVEIKAIDLKYAREIVGIFTGLQMRTHVLSKN